MLGLVLDLSGALATVAMLLFFQGRHADKRRYPRGR
jgi:hypothetical protein